MKSINRVPNRGNRVRLRRHGIGRGGADDADRPNMGGMVVGDGALARDGLAQRMPRASANAATCASAAE